MGHDSLNIMCRTTRVELTRSPLNLKRRILGAGQNKALVKANNRMSVIRDSWKSALFSFSDFYLLYRIWQRTAIGWRSSDRHIGELSQSWPERLTPYLMRSQLQVSKFWVLFSNNLKINYNYCKNINQQILTLCRLEEVEGEIEESESVLAKLNTVELILS